MQRLSFITLLLLGFIGSVSAQNPHGDDFIIDCKECHNPGGWSVDLETMAFSHDSVGFELEGRHEQITCKDCHTTLVFDEVGNDCVDCHTDIHNMSVGNDCVRCHDSESWLVNNIPELHEQNGFPLLGQHRVADCTDCHRDESELEWSRIGNECVSCHMEDYMAALEPNHQLAGFSTECTECHAPLAQDWTVDNFHGFFPLEGGHDIDDCAACHLDDNYANTSPECVSCHQDDFDATSEPNHQDAGFSTDCAQCHDPLTPGWGGTGDFHMFFPLEGGHDIQDCNECHEGTDYAAASPECVSCHLDDFQATTEPDHEAAGFSTDCLECHSPAADTWGAENFHLFFPLEGGHDVQDCNQCHDGNDYAAASPECISCHQDDFNNADSPNHVDAGFGTNCLECHTTNNWDSAILDQHDGLYFPIFSGRHDNEWNTCDECHTTPENYMMFSCIECHEHDDPADLADIHDEDDITGYVYESSACYGCHPTGEAE